MAAVSSFQRVHSAADLAPFAGTIVAIQDRHPHFTPATTLRLSLLFFAYIPSLDAGSKPSSHLSLLMRAGRIQSGAVAARFSLDKRPVAIRAASTQELSLIKQAIESSQGVFSTLVCKNAQKDVIDLLKKV